MTQNLINKLILLFFFLFKKKKYLNIGSGSRLWPGWHLIDEIEYKVKFITIVKKVKIKKLQPLPFKNNYFSIIYSSHFFEHIDNITVNYLLSETNRLNKNLGLFILKLPDFELFHDAYLQKKYSFLKQILDENGISMSPTWKNYNVEYSLENRLANLFTSYINIHIKDLFNANIKEKFNNLSYVGPPKIDNLELKNILQSRNLNKIGEILRNKALKENDFYRFNHQNLWSKNQIIHLVEKKNFKLVNSNKNFIIKNYTHIIPDLMEMKNWSAYFMFQKI